jgi:hypothetical protein
MGHQDWIIGFLSARPTSAQTGYYQRTNLDLIPSFFAGGVLE